jgi:hypothetical protein
MSCLCCLCVCCVLLLYDLEKMMKRVITTTTRWSMCCSMWIILILIFHWISIILSNFSSKCGRLFEKHWTSDGNLRNYSKKLQCRVCVLFKKVNEYIWIWKKSPKNQQHETTWWCNVWSKKLKYSWKFGYVFCDSCEWQILKVVCDSKRVDEMWLRIKSSTLPLCINRKKFW